jgi:hypothetical protein
MCSWGLPSKHILLAKIVDIAASGTMCLSLGTYIQVCAAQTSVRMESISAPGVEGNVASCNLISISLLPKSRLWAVGMAPSYVIPLMTHSDTQTEPTPEPCTSFNHCTFTADSMGFQFSHSCSWMPHLWQFAPVTPHAAACHAHNFVCMPPLQLHVTPTTLCACHSCSCMLHPQPCVHATPAAACHLSTLCAFRSCSCLSYP